MHAHGTFYMLSVAVLLAAAGLTARSALASREAAADDVDLPGKAAPTPDDVKPGEDPAAKRGSLERKLRIARAKVEQAALDGSAQEADSKQAIDHARGDLEIATAKLAQVRDIDGPNRVAQAELALQQARDAAEEAAEELKQIEIMYEEQDLADRTAEFVINRGKRNAERRAQHIEIEARALRALREHEIVREQAALELDVARKRAALEKAERDASTGRLGKAIARMAAEAEAAELEEQLAQLDVTEKKDDTDKGKRL
jgi:hypothetical protein